MYSIMQSFMIYMPLRGYMISSLKWTKIVHKSRYHPLVYLTGFDYSFFIVSLINLDFLYSTLLLETLICHSYSIFVRYYVDREAGASHVHMVVNFNFMFLGTFFDFFFDCLYFQVQIHIKNLRRRFCMFGIFDQFGIVPELYAMIHERF